ncbi:MAG: TldD/PmbA family protein [Deltaproteobacteria bacterium]|nr:TldD/PmbA family protein [Deltaproteobacteria bacterium]
MDGWLLDFDPGPVLGRALRHGADHADLFAEHTRHHAVVLEGGQIEVASSGEQRGMSLRTLERDGRFQLASAAAIDRLSALALADDLTSFDRRPAGVPRAPDGIEMHRAVAQVHPTQVSMEARNQLVRLAERVARGTSPRIAEVRVVLRDLARRTAIAGSDGRLGGTETVRAALSVEVIARHGDRTETAHEAIGGTGGFELLDQGHVAHAARIAALRAVRTLDARPAPAGAMPVVLAAEAGGTFVHEAVGHPLEADLVHEGLSVFGGRIGEPIASAALSVVDDATLAGKNGSFPLDDEGTPAQRTLLIDRGVLVGYLSDERTARLLGLVTTGKARRESFRDRPLVRMSNTLITPGKDDPRAIIRDTERGLYVVRMGGGEVDTLTGHFVFEVSEAYLIRGGRIADPVRGATLTGDTQAVLQSIDRVGSDLGFGLGVCGKDGQDVPIADGEPTLRIPELVVGGPSDAE